MFYYRDKRYKCIRWNSLSALGPALSYMYSVNCRIPDGSITGDTPKQFEVLNGVADVCKVKKWEI